MIIRPAVAGWCLSMFCIGSASAQPASNESLEAVESAALAYEPQYTPPPEAAPVPAEIEEAPTPSRLELLAFGSADIGVPIVLNVNHDLIRPGANVHLQGGLDIGYVAFFLHTGWRFIPVDFDRAAKDNPEYEGEGRDPLKNPYVGFGVRGQVPNDSPFRPYASASFEANFWNFRETTVSCSGSYYYAWYCNDHNVYKFSPGFTGRAGVAADLGLGLFLDLGLGVSVSLEGKFFDDNELWLEPFAGVGYRG